MKPNRQTFLESSVWMPVSQSGHTPNTNIRQKSPSLRKTLHRSQNLFKHCKVGHILIKKKQPKHNIFGNICGCFLLSLFLYHSHETTVAHSSLKLETSALEELQRVARPGHLNFRAVEVVTWLTRDRWWSVYYLVHWFNTCQHGVAHSTACLKVFMPHTQPQQASASLC